MNLVCALLGVLLLLLALLAAGLLWFLRRPLPQTRGTIAVPGLQNRVKVLRDRWGVPHLYADSAGDLFIAQGYVHAQDRMWQMEFQRRLAAGRLSEILGEATLELDRLFRTLGLYRAAEADVAVLGDESRQALEAYAAGVNAYIAAHEGRWSVEFNLLRATPEPWRPADSLAWLKVMAWQMGCNWASELIRARLAVALGAERAADLEPAYPADNPTIVPGPGLPEGAEPPPNGWRSEALRDALQRAEDLFRTEAVAPPPETPLPTPGLAPGGSNQWVVAGSRSATGQPLLSNDTHLLLSMPSAWYQNHLVGGGYHVTGVSLPGLPAVAVGHNEDCAWGITIAWQDAQDLYVERLNPENPHQYEYEGEWHDAEVFREEIRVKGQAEPVVQEVVVTRHGPLIDGLVGEERPLALRWAALDANDLLGSALRANRAQNWDDFREGLAGWAAPSMNFVFADRAGNIGYLQAGRVPVRAGGHHGLAPVPGWNGEYEWQAYLPLEELPQAYNPASGWLATANNLVVDDAYPHYLSADLENPTRARRIVDLITARESLTADDFARFQRDTHSAQAEALVRHLLAIEPESEQERRALAYLEAWDARLEPESVAASLYAVCRLRALHGVFDGHLGDLAEVYVGAQGLTALGENSPYHDRSIVRLLDLLEGKDEGDSEWLRDPASGRMRSRQEVLHQALREALALLEAELGPDMGRWTWGRLNRVRLPHPLGAVKPLNLLFNRGPYPSGGTQDTLLRASGKPRFPFEPVEAGDALRFVADVSDWERCRIVVPGGQSGHVASRHYADLLPLWRRGRFQPMPFARERVEHLAQARLVLVPGVEG